GKADSSDGRRVKALVVTSDNLGHDLALCRALVGQHRLAGKVTNGPDVLHRGGAAVVDLHERAVHGHAHILQTPALGAGAAAHGHQHLVGGQLQRVAVLVRDVQLAVTETTGAGPQ